jgi:phosphohistidine phosphatase
MPGAAGAFRKRDLVDMKHVSLLRHAKALPADSSGDDFARPLAESGRAVATRVGQSTMAEVPDLVLCSPARRTRETFDLVSQVWPHQPEVQFEVPLYLAEWDDLLERLKQLPEETSNVWIVGHNPGLHELAIEFARYGGLPVIDGDLGRHFPTGTRVAFSFDIAQWKSLPSAKTKLSAFVITR